MTSLFKYCGSIYQEENGIESGSINILRNRYLKVSPPNDFNDPFELLAQTHPRLPTREEFDSDMQYSSEARKMMHTKLQQSGYPGSFSQFLKEYAFNPNPFYEWYSSNIAPNYANILKDMPDEFSEKFGIVCFSKSPNQILMWSHYSDKHAGMVLEFDSDKLPGSRNTRVPVDYQPHRVAIRPTFSNSDKENQENFDLLIRRKNLDWKYEEEVRVVAELGKKNSFGHYDLTFNTEALTAIYFGCKCTQKHQASTRDECKRTGYGHVKFYQMKIHETDFALISQPLEP